jgi:hypothetical protein
VQAPRCLRWVRPPVTRLSPGAAPAGALPGTCADVNPHRPAGEGVTSFWVVAGAGSWRRRQPRRRRGGHRPATPARLPPASRPWSRRRRRGRPAEARRQQVPGPARRRRGWWRAPSPSTRTGRPPTWPGPAAGRHGPRLPRRAEPSPRPGRAASHGRDRAVAPPRESSARDTARRPAGRARARPWRVRRPVAGSATAAHFPCGTAEVAAPGRRTPARRPPVADRLDTDQDGRDRQLPRRGVHGIRRRDRRPAADSRRSCGAARDRGGRPAPRQRDGPAAHVDPVDGSLWISRGRPARCPR